MPLGDFCFRSIKPSIFCDIICVSKRTLVIWIRILYCTAFFKIKSFVILFFLSFLWFISGEGISLGLIFPVGNFLGAKFLRGNFRRRGAFLGGIFIGGILIGGNFLAANFLGGGAHTLLHSMWYGFEADFIMHSNLWKMVVLM